MKDWKRALTLTLALALTVCLGITARAAGDSPFEDVDSSAWYSADVTAVYQTGLFNGTSDTSFDPEGTLSLAQSAALAARLHQYAHSGAVTLQNGTDQWYSTYVDYAKQNGIISGEYDGRWSETATRAEMVKILYHALDADSYTAINTVEDNAIPDVKTGWAACDEIYAFYRAGILAGGEGNKFNSKSTIQRCEVAAILNRMLDPERRQSVTLTLPELPAYGAEATPENVLAVLDNLDPDGAFILRATATGNVSTIDYDVNGNTGTAEAVDFMVHWVSPGRNFLAQFCTAVHEECHRFTHRTASYGGENIYIGNGEHINVKYTEVFDSVEMARNIPEHLRTYRYTTYVGEAASQYTSSRQYGPYGLLNEFTAYCWDNNNLLKLGDYLIGSGDDSASWVLRGNAFLAYAEFRFYTLRYMMYAKENYPDIYQGILENDNYRLAFSTIDSIFSDIVEMRLSSGSGMTTGYNDYEMLMAEMEKPEYQEMLALLKP